MLPAFCPAPDVRVDSNGPGRGRKDRGRVGWGLADAPGGFDGNTARP